VAVATALNHAGDLQPVVLIEAADADAARRLEALVPRLFGLVLGEVEVKGYKIDGQSVRSVDESEDSSTGLPPHYGRHGKVLVLGWNRRYVAATLKAAGRKKDLLGLPRALAAVHREGAVSALGLLACRAFLEDVRTLKAEKEEPTEEDRRECNYLRELAAPMATMPPTLFVLKRRPDGALFEMRQTELRTASATVFDILLPWLAEKGVGCSARFRVDGPPRAGRGPGRPVGPGLGPGSARARGDEEEAR
jgi:hypothetical protein